MVEGIVNMPLHVALAAFGELAGSLAEKLTPDMRAEVAKCRAVQIRPLHANWVDGIVGSMHWLEPTTMPPLEIGRWKGNLTGEDGRHRARAIATKLQMADCTDEVRALWAVVRCVVADRADQKTAILAGTAQNLAPDVGHPYDDMDAPYVLARTVMLTGGQLPQQSEIQSIFGCARQSAGDIRLAAQAFVRIGPDSAHRYDAYALKTAWVELGRLFAGNPDAKVAVPGATRPDEYRDDHAWCRAAFLVGADGTVRGSGDIRRSIVAARHVLAGTDGRSAPTVSPKVAAKRLLGRLEKVGSITDSDVRGAEPADRAAIIVATAPVVRAAHLAQLAEKGPLAFFHAQLKNTLAALPRIEDLAKIEEEEYMVFATAVTQGAERLRDVAESAFKARNGDAGGADATT